MATAAPQAPQVIVARLWHSRAAGVVIEVEHVARAAWRLTIEYEVAQQTFQIQPASHYSERGFEVGQQVTILYPPNRPQLGMLDSFHEQWQVPVFLSIVSLALLALAWKARSGLSPTLHAWCCLLFLVLGGIVGATLFALLCVPEGLDVLAGGGPLVKLVGGILLFFRHGAHVRLRRGRPLEKACSRALSTLQRRDALGLDGQANVLYLYLVWRWFSAGVAGRAED